MQKGEPFLRCNRTRPCPACGKLDWCTVSHDGMACICARVQSDDRRGEAGWLHKLRRERPMAVPKPQRPTVDWRKEAEQYAQAMTAGTRLSLERLLHLPDGSLSIFPLLGLGKGTRPDEAEVKKGEMKFATFPEWDGRGNLIGLCRRFSDHSKFQLAGGGRGLSVPHGFDPSKCRLVFVVEGPTDVAAMVAAGLSAVGRPSNSGGGNDLSVLFERCPDDCRIVVVGENDEKVDHQWPGLAAGRVAEQLAHNLQRWPGAKKFPVQWAMTPDVAKDVRAWLTDSRWGDTAWNLRGELLANHMLRAAVAAEPSDVTVRRVQAESERVKEELAEVRRQMKEILERLSRR